MPSRGHDDPKTRAWGRVQRCARGYASAMRIARQGLAWSAACGLLCSTASYSADESEYTVLTLLSGRLDRASVVEIAASAFIRRKWVLERVSENQVVGHLDHRGVSATLELKILSDRIVYSCECTRITSGDRHKGGNSAVRMRLRRRSSSSALRSSASGEVPLPKRWINNLRVDIQGMLSTARARRPDDGAKRTPIVERLKVLEDLLTRGLVSQEEYAAKRAEILSDL